MKDRDKNYRLCPYPWTQMAVTYSGDCVPCCRDTAARSVLGNVFDNSIMTVWNGEKYRQFRRNLIDKRPDLNQACRHCDLPFSGGQPRWQPGYLYRSLVKR
jgi:radical SAM protein with 4Fe4S-binding SPASM domain